MKKQSKPLGTSDISEDTAFIHGLRRWFLRMVEGFNGILERQVIFFKNSRF